MAVGSIMTETDGVSLLAALVGTYEIFDETHHEADAEFLLDRLTAMRLARELPPPDRVADLWPDARVAADAIRHGEDPQHAMHDLSEIATSVVTQGMNIGTWYAETSELAEFEFPEEYVSAPELGVAIGVSHRRLPDSGWGRYVVMMVMTSH